MYIAYESCKLGAETNHHGGTEESGERTEKMTTTLQTVHHVCAMCVVEYVDQQSAFIATSALIEHKLTHSRGIARERERERESIRASTSRNRAGTTEY